MEIMTIEEAVAHFAPMAKKRNKKMTLAKKQAIGLKARLLNDIGKTSRLVLMKDIKKGEITLTHYNNLSEELRQKFWQKKGEYGYLWSYTDYMAGFRYEKILFTTIPELRRWDIDFYVTSIETEKMEPLWPCEQRYPYDPKYHPSREVWRKKLIPVKETKEIWGKWVEQETAHHPPGAHPGNPISEV